MNHFNWQEVRDDVGHASLASIYVAGIVGLAIIAIVCSVVGMPS